MTLAAVLLETLRLNPQVSDARLEDAWRSVPLDGLVSLLQYEGGELWLYRRWQEIGLRRELIRDPSCWDAIEMAARRTGAQNLLVRSHGEAVVTLLRRHSIPCVFIKGIARQCLTDEFPFADARATNDVDLLIPREYQARAWDCLIEAGYQPQLGNTPEGHYHLPPLCNRERVPVELHSSTSPMLDPDDAWRRLGWSPPSDEQDRPSPDSRTVATELLWHSLTHAFTHSTAAFRMRFFIDAAAVLAGPGSVDWSHIRSRLESEEIRTRWRALAWLDVATWLGGSELPEDLQPAPALQYHVTRMTAWRLAIFSRTFRSRSWRDKLLSEATSAELQMPTTPGVPGTSWPVKLRRRTASLLARLVYRRWRRGFASAEPSGQRGLHGAPQIGQREREPLLSETKGLDPLTRK